MTIGDRNSPRPDLENFLRPLDLPKDEEELATWFREAVAMVASEDRLRAEPRSAHAELKTESERFESRGEDGLSDDDVSQ